MPFNQKVKKGILGRGLVTDPDYHGETGLPLYNGGKKAYVWSAENPLRLPLVPLCLVIKVNGKLQ